MRHGEGKHADARFVFHIQHRTVYQIPVGIGPVQYQQLFSIFVASFHEPHQRIDIGIKPAAYILQIIDQHIHIGHILGSRLIF
jgi:hypothetical protein